MFHKCLLLVSSVSSVLVNCGMKELSFEQSGYSLVKKLIHPHTGLVMSANDETMTTVYKNALAVFVLIHEGNMVESERIFNHFLSYYLANKEDFHGFPQIWNVQTGLPDTASIHWEGDAAFLLLSLNYYTQASDNSDKYQDLISGIVSWLSHRANSCDLIVAEGVADMYAALAPLSKKHNVHTSLERLHQCFFSRGSISSRDYEQNLNHIVRGALVFSDTSGFVHLNNFLKAVSRDLNYTLKITGYTTFAGHGNINIEVTTQLRLTLKLWQSEIKFNALALCDEIKRQVKNTNNFLPKISYLTMGIEKKDSHGFSILEPVCYLLFYYWNFNPFAPGKKSAVNF